MSFLYLGEGGVRFFLFMRLINQQFGTYSKSKFIEKIINNPVRQQGQINVLDTTGKKFRLILFPEHLFSI
jgi:hypothetical protein